MSASHSRTGMMAFPHPIALKIFGYLELKDVARLKRVNKAHYKLACCSELWSVVDGYRLKSRNFQDLLAAIFSLSHPSVVQSIVIPARFKDFNKDTSQELTDMCPNLRSISFCPDLEEISFLGDRGVVYTFPAQALQHLTASCPIEKLELVNSVLGVTAWKSLAKHCSSSLRHFTHRSIKGNIHFDQSALKSLLSACTALVGLDLRERAEDGPFLLTEIANSRCASNLTDLGIRLSTLSSLTPAAEIPINQGTRSPDPTPTPIPPISAASEILFSKFRNLRVLRLETDPIEWKSARDFQWDIFGSAPRATDPDFHTSNPGFDLALPTGSNGPCLPLEEVYIYTKRKFTLSGNCPNLSKLEISGHELPPITLTSFQCPSLTNLSLSDLNFPNEKLSAFLDILPNLEILNLIEIGGLVRPSVTHPMVRELKIVLRADGEGVKIDIPNAQVLKIGSKRLLGNRLFSLEVGGQKLAKLILDFPESANLQFKTFVLDCPNLPNLDIGHRIKYNRKRLEELSQYRLLQLDEKFGPTTISGNLSNLRSASLCVNGNCDPSFFKSLFSIFCPKSQVSGSQPQISSSQVSGSGSQCSTLRLNVNLSPQLVNPKLADGPPIFDFLGEMLSQNFPVLKSLNFSFSDTRYVLHSKHPKSPPLLLNFPNLENLTILTPNIFKHISLEKCPKIKNLHLAGSLDGALDHHWLKNAESILSSLPRVNCLTALTLEHCSAFSKFDFSNFPCLTRFTAIQTSFKQIEFPKTESGRSRAEISASALTHPPIGTPPPAPLRQEEFLLEELSLKCTQFPIESLQKILSDLHAVAKNLKKLSLGDGLVEEDDEAACVGPAGLARIKKKSMEECKQISKQESPNYEPLFQNWPLLSLPTPFPPSLQHLELGDLESIVLVNLSGLPLLRSIILNACGTAINFEFLFVQICGHPTLEKLVLNEGSSEYLKKKREGFGDVVLKCPNLVEFQLEGAFTSLSLDAPRLRQAKINGGDFTPIQTLQIEIKCPQLLNLRLSTPSKRVITTMETHKFANVIYR